MPLRAYAFTGVVRPLPEVKLQRISCQVDIFLVSFWYQLSVQKGRMTRECVRLNSSALLTVAVKSHTSLFKSMSDRHVLIYGTLTAISVSGSLTSS